MLNSNQCVGTELESEFNQFLGFYTEVKNEKRKLTILIATRSYYRLYINGQIIANGQARCAKHYCRVDVRNIDNEKIQVVKKSYPLP